MMTTERSSDQVRIARIGYGPRSSIRWAHNNLISETDGLVDTAVYDPSEESRKAACEEIGTDFHCYESLEELLADDAADLCLLATPHNTHADLAVQCLQAGHHVVVEKPMCITYEEAQRMLDAAQKAGKVLTVFHNRRWDGDIQAIRQTVLEEKLLGEVFHVEMFNGGFKAPRGIWRDDAAVSGGSHYDWGAHAVDQALQLFPDSSLDTIFGAQHAQRIWTEVSSEDHIQMLVRFNHGEILDVQFSRIAHVGRPKWRILGTQGALVCWGGGSSTLYTKVGSHSATAEIQHGKNDWGGFYRNLAAHFLNDEPLAVPPEEAARVVAVLEYAGRAARENTVYQLPCD